MFDPFQNMSGIERLWAIFWIGLFVSLSCCGVTKNIGSALVILGGPALSDEPVEQDQVPPPG